MKLGLFSINGKGGIAKVDAPPISWSRNIRIACGAEALGFGALVPYARWRRRGIQCGKHDVHEVYDSFTWAAGVSQATTRISVFAMGSATAAT